MRFGRKILAAIKEGAAPRLDPALWDFFSDTKRISGDHQLLPWLHYEYARSYRPVVEAVQRIRNHPADPEPTFAFAKMLAKRFPEFPATPWLAISNSRRERRLADLRKLEVESPTLTPGSPVRLYTLKEFYERILPETYVSDSAPDGRRFFVAEVCFDATGPVIAADFQTRFEQMRADLIREFDQRVTVPRAGQAGGEHHLQWKESNYFQPKHQRRQVGRGSKPAQIKSFLRALGGMRLMAFCRGNWENAEAASRLLNGEYLFSERKSWNRAQQEAGLLLLRLRLLWRWNAGFEDVLDYPQFAHTLLAPLSHPIPRSTKTGKASTGRPPRLTAQEKDQIAAMLKADIALP